MKRQLINLLTIIIIVLTLPDCKKEIDDNGEDLFSYRVISSNTIGISGIQNFTAEELYEYTGNKITKYHYTLDSNSITYIYSYSSSNLIKVKYTIDNWFEGTIELHLRNNRVVEKIEDDHKTTFTYNSSNQIEEIFDYEFKAEWELNQKKTFSYDSSKLFQVLFWSYFNNEIKEKKYVYEYNGNEISNIIKYRKQDGIWEEYSKEVFTYTSGKITKIQKYNIPHYGDYIELFKYDEYGNLTEVYTKDESYPTFESTKIISYEVGSGNYRLIFAPFNYWFYESRPIPNKKSQRIENVVSTQNMNIILNLICNDNISNCSIDLIR